MEKIILFGAGELGNSIYEFLQHRREENIVECFCDNNVGLHGKRIGNVMVCNYEECKGKDNKFVITSTKYAAEIEALLKKDHKEYFTDISEWALAEGIDGVEWNRDYCAWYHTD